MSRIDVAFNGKVIMQQRDKFGLRALKFPRPRRGEQIATFVVFLGRHLIDRVLSDEREALGKCCHLLHLCHSG